MFCSGAFAHEQDTIVVEKDTITAVDCVQTTVVDSVQMAGVDSIPAKEKNKFIKKAKKSLAGIVVKAISTLFFEADTNYVEPQHYKFQAIMKNELNYEIYEWRDNVGNAIRFEPEPSLKIGPSAGWSIFMGGYTIDVLHLRGKDNRKEFTASLWCLSFGLDLFWRQSGTTYKISRVTMRDGTDTSAMTKVPFDGFQSSVTGLNLYYVFNHNHFSYPAAFSQSTQQKRSAGSPVAGIGFTRHSLDINWEQLNALMTAKLGSDAATKFVGERKSEKITYSDLSVSGGYGYNWVFAKNWLFSSSLSLAVSYKRSIADTSRGLNAVGESINFRDFKFADLSLDGVGRFGLVWNNLKWFAGAKAIVHSYNYSRQNFYTNNIFGSVNVYAGFNFGIKKKYKRTFPQPLP